MCWSKNNCNALKEMKSTEELTVRYRLSIYIARWSTDSPADLGSYIRNSYIAYMRMLTVYADCISRMSYI